jgi:ATP-dependent Clp protease ATP-binding subunit ClpX
MCGRFFYNYFCSIFMPSDFSVIIFADLLHITGIGHGASGLGVGFQHTPPPEPEPRRPAASSTMGSDILDSNSHELKLEKSNILLLGPTGSG